MRNGEEGASGLRVLRNQRAAGTLRSRIHRGALMSKAGTGVTTQPVMHGVRAGRCRHMVGGSHLTHASRPLSIDCILGVPDIRCGWSALCRRTAPALDDWCPLLLLFADASPWKTRRNVGTAQSFGEHRSARASVRMTGLRRAAQRESVFTPATAWRGGRGAGWRNGGVRGGGPPPRRVAGWRGTGNWHGRKYASIYIGLSEPARALPRPSISI